jgi:hypothetical protein
VQSIFAAAREKGGTEIVGSGATFLPHLAPTSVPEVRSAGMIKTISVENPGAD